MIGKTIFYYRCISKKTGNKDVSLLDIRIARSLAALLFFAQIAVSQTQQSTQSYSIYKSSIEGKTQFYTGLGFSLAMNQKAQMSSADIDDNGEQDEADFERAPSASTESLTSNDSEAAEESQVNNNKELESEGSTASAADENINDQESAAKTENLSNSKTDSTTSQEAPSVELHSELKQNTVPMIETAPVSENSQETEYVEVIPYEKNVEVLAIKEYNPYRERRSTHGFLFNLGTENLYFPDYTSILDSKLYEEMFGQEDITLAQVHLDYKLNFFLGAVVAGLGYGQGTLIDDRSLEERSLTMKKSLVRAQFFFDTLMKEPYFVPYVGFDYWQIDIDEANITLDQKASYSTDYGDAIKVGFLLQLNWIEPETSKLAYLNYGLENTYLDVFWTQYNGSNGEFDPILTNDLNFGLGLRMEF